VRFLIDANMPRRSGDLIRSCGHDAIDVRDVGMADSPDEPIAALARSERRCILTRDKDFGNIRDYPPAEYAGIVVFSLDETLTADSILDILGAFLDQQEVLASLTGKLAIVEPGQVRLRSD